MTDTAFSVQAQQRYRERRKQKFSEMEESLHVLASQVEQMNTVQTQNSMLQVAATLTSQFKLSESVTRAVGPMFSDFPADATEIT